MKSDRFVELAERYGTPLYVYDAEKIAERCRKVLELFADFDFLPTFAVKANNNPNILKLVHSHGFGADVVTRGEFRACELAGIPPEMLVWNGNGKTREDMEYFIEHGIRYVNVDSFEEMELWNERLPRCASIIFLVRVNPDIDPKTHPHISTGMKMHKFGVDEDQLEKFMKKFGRTVKGVHIHVGSQIIDVKVFVEAYSRALELCDRYSLEYLNIGGGWGIAYKGKGLDIEDYKKKAIPILKKFKGRIILELGRYIVGEAGYLILKVIQVKRTMTKVFVVTDGGMNQLIRPALYNAYHEIEIPNATDEETMVDVVGPLCETGDMIARERKMKLPRVGSYLIVEGAGAYGYSMSNNYNSTLRAAEVLISGKRDQLIRRRETLDDLFRSVIL
ncbi:MAG: diaminopimelate decarboxylase [Thermotogae bacterium]|nr:diaminopimelate decarboxylase [Thermotogota bacterium]